MMIVLGQQGATPIPLDALPEDRTQKAKLLFSLGVTAQPARLAACRNDGSAHSANLPTAFSSHSTPWPGRSGTMI
jgi:hypothetical protein